MTTLFEVYDTADVIGIWGSSEAPYSMAFLSGQTR